MERVSYMMKNSLTQFYAIDEMFTLFLIFLSSQKEIIGSTGMTLSEVERNLTLLFTSYKRSKRYQSFSQVELFQSIMGLKAGN